MKLQVPPKVTYISGAYPPIRDGVGFYLKKLTDHLRGVDYQIITSEGASGSGHVQPVIKSWRSGVEKIIETRIGPNPAGIIHMQYGSVRYGRKFGVTLLPARLIKHFAGTPFVITIHEYHDASWLGRKRVELMLRPVRNIIVSNQVDERLLQKKFAQKSIRRIPIGSNIDVVEFSPNELAKLRKQSNPENKKVLLSWGLLDANKGLDKLVSAMGELGTNVKLLIASGHDPSISYHQKLQQQIDRCGADIEWLDFLDDRKISGLLQIADLVVLPFNQPVSLRRGSVLAALSHGKVVVTTGPSEDSELQNRKNCYLLGDNSPESIAKAINELFDDHKLAKLLSMQARELAAQFDWDKIAKQHVKIYHQLIHQDQN